jgi:hypothetical protein
MAMAATEIAPIPINTLFLAVHIENRRETRRFLEASLWRISMRAILNNEAHQTGFDI